MRPARFLLLLPILLGLVACHDDDDDDFFFILLNTPPPTDLDGDGFADLVIGAPFDDGAGAIGSERGAVEVYFGSAAGLPATPDLTIFGQEDGARFGASVAFPGDVNGRGAPDLLVGAPFDDADGNATDDGIDRGRAFVFFGGTGMDANPDVILSGVEDGGLFGTSVARVRDTDGDGFGDFLVGAPLDDGDGNATDEGVDRGRAFFFFGSDPPRTSPNVIFTGSEDGGEFGRVVSSAGDLNAGGASDIAIGAPFDDGDGNTTDEFADRGRVFVFYGGTALDATPDLTLTGDEDGAEFGSAIAPVLDVNDDGVHDLLVGAPFHDAGAGAGADRGEAVVFFGSATPDAVPDLVLSGSEDGGAFGGAVGRARDVDGDGERDFLVGAPLESPGGRTEAGRAYLYLGGAAVDATPDLTFDGPEAGAEFGSALAGPGDLDGGGRDILIGAPFDDADGNATDEGFDVGSVFFFSGGGPALDTTPDAIFDGAHDQSGFGAALAD